MYVQRMALFHRKTPKGIIARIRSFVRKNFHFLRNSLEQGERRGSNPRQPGPQPGTLPTELLPPGDPPFTIIIFHLQSPKCRNPGQRTAPAKSVGPWTWCYLIARCPRPTYLLPPVFPRSRNRIESPQCIQFSHFRDTRGSFPCANFVMIVRFFLHFLGNIAYGIPIASWGTVVNFFLLGSLRGDEKLW